MKTPKRRVVWFHYNKPLSKSSGKDLWSVHYKNVCHFVEHIDCKIPTKSKNNKKQPRVVMKGFAKSVDIVGNCAIIM